MNRNNKRFTQEQSGFIPVMIILLVLIGFVGVYFLGTLKNKPLVEVSPITSPTVTSEVPTSKPVVDPTANWKLYTNKDYGFSIQYPPDAKLRVNQPESSDRMMVVAFDSPNAVFDHLFKSGGYSFELSIQTQKNFETLDKYLDFQKEHSMYEKVTPKTFNNINGYLFNNDKGFSGLSFTYRGFVAKNNDLFYTVNYFTDETTDIFNQILSTFKFID